MDWMDSVIGAAIALGGVVVGRLTRRRPRELKPPEPFCGCEHHVSYHKDHTGKCGWKEVFPYACGCQKYSGPTPLPEYYAPEI